MKNKVFLKIGLVCTMLFAGFNFLPQFKTFGIPIFQFLIVFCIVISFTLYKIQFKSDIIQIKYYFWYLITSLPAVFLGVFYEADDVLLVYFYTLFPFLLFVTTFDKIDKFFYHKLLTVLNFSAILITIIGWLLRFSILPLYTFFEVIDSEFDVGYWGIRYTESTRNNDYLYPLVGLSISMYFFVLKKYKLLNLILIFFFLITLIASFSRAALIISFLSIFLLIKSSSTKLRFGVVLISLLIIIINYNFIINEYETKFKFIAASVFQTKNLENQFSNEERLIVIKEALEFALINPLGSGICNYNTIYDKNYRGRVSNSAENAYLTILVERGWLAFLFLIYFLFISLKRSYLNKEISLNKFLLPFLFIYFLFNYELNNIFGTFIFYLVFLCIYYEPRLDLISQKSNEKKLQY